MLNLSKFVEEDGDDEQENQLEIRRNQKRSDWAKGKTRTQPSENWDDDFLFGSASVESLPLPPKSSDLHHQLNTHKKPGSSQSIRPNPANPPPSRSYHHHQSNSSHSRASFTRAPSRSTSNQQSQDPDPVLLSQHSQDSLTPRKRRPPNLESSSLSHHPSSLTTTTLTHTTRNVPPSYLTAPHLFNSSRSSPARRRPSLSRPPASAPPSRGQSVDGTSSVEIVYQRRVPPIPLTLLPRSLHSSLTHDHPHSSHQVISSQDSMPSISDLSSIGFRSPSSSLSMTDDSRGDWSHSSADHSRRFRGNGCGNLSFNTETEFTEPDLEFDWVADDTDHENRRAPTRFLNKNQRTQSPQQALISPSYNPPSTPSSANLQSSFAHHRDQFCPTQPPLPVSPLEHVLRPSTSPSHKPSDHNQSRRPTTNTSIASQSTTTSTQTSRSRKAFLNNQPTTSPSATSSASSIGYYKSNCSDVSLNSSTAVYSLNQHNDPNLVSTQDTRHQHPIRSLSCSSNCSNNFSYYRSGSDSYDPATSGTETDCVSDHYNLDDKLYQPISSSTSFDPHRNTPTVSQRSRKQALYSRPSHVSPSAGSSLAGSISASTLDASEASLDTHVEVLRLNDVNPNHSSNSEHVALQDDKSSGKNPTRRRFRRKKPSTLHLKKTASSLNGAADSSTLTRSPTSASSYRNSATAPVCPQAGDLAFAVDSEDEERKQSRSSAAHRQLLPVETLKKSDTSISRTLPRIPSSGNRGLSTRSRTSINRSHASMQVTNENKQSLSPPDTTSDESSGKIFKPKRPLSFTALFSRGSTNVSYPPPEHLPTAQINNPDQLSRSCFGHRYSTSIDSTPHYLGSSTCSQTSNDSILSRVRRLSSRPNHTSNPSHVSPTRKRFSLVGDTPRRMSFHQSATVASSKVMATPLKAIRAANDKFSTALKSNRRQTSQSDSMVSDVTMTAVDSYDTVRARRPSSRTSCSNSSVTSSTQPTLARKFSRRSNNKSTINEPDLCRSPTDNRIDHDFSSSSQGISRLLPKRTLASKPPKSNPALRARAEANAQLQDYQIKADHYPQPSPSQQSIYSEASLTDSEQSPTSPPRELRYPYTRGLSNHVPNSEPLPTPMSDVEHETQVANHLAHIGNMTGPLARSNSMGELRIPSRITSQQGRLQTELNQVKEFARGIEELKSMRRTYRKLIRATRRSAIDQSFAITDESDGNSTDSDHQKDPEPLPDREQQQCEDNSLVKPNQVSPRALDRLYAIIQKIQDEYKEWWTCCNVLIDLGEGSTDPRTKFSAERVRAITSYSQGPLEQVLEPPQPAITLASPETEPGSHKHFEILKSMFAPGGEEKTPTTDQPPYPPRSCGTSPDSSFPGTSPEPAGTPVRCQTPPMNAPREVDLGDKTPMSRFVNKAEGLLAVQQPETPTLTPRKARSNELRETREKSPKSVGRLSDCSESEGSWTGLVVDRSVPQSAPAVSRERTPTKLENGYPKERRKPPPSRYSSYRHHSERIASSEAVKPKSNAGTRIGISGIKDFLRVLKARVHAEEKWPGNPSLSFVGLKRRSISSTLQTFQQKKSGTSVAAESLPSTDSPPSTKPATPGQGSRSASTAEPASPNDGTGSVSSSEEECWDELFGFKETSASNTESLDLALPPLHQQQLLLQKKKTPAPIGEARLALSSDRMPQLLSYLAVVKDQCRECLVELKSQTV